MISLRFLVSLANKVLYGAISEQCDKADLLAYHKRSEHYHALVSLVVPK